MKRLHHHIIIFLTLLSLLTTGAAPSYAETIDSSAASTLAASKGELEKQLAEIEAQINAFEKQLSATQGEKKTLTNAITKLKNQQNSLILQVKSTTLKLNQINTQLNKTEKDISVTKSKESRLKTQIGTILRLLNGKDQQILIVSLTESRGLADVSQTIEDYSKIFFTLASLNTQTRALHDSLQKQQVAYQDQQDDAEQLIKIKNAQQQELLGKLSEQKGLLQETQGKESNYQQILTDKRKEANAIRNRIYDLVGGGTQITFEKAVEIATWVGKQTGIRPAFLLAILTQESNLGKNVGTCNRPNDPPEKSWKVIMKPDRDQEPFKTITSELGRDPDVTPVSCPLRDSKGKIYGWGGAMGPAQFIPSTWMGYRKKVTAITGKPADPWNITDAFIASASKLAADGASSKEEDGEWKAAMKYFAGSVNLKYRFYGDNVLKTMRKYLEEIDEITTANYKPQ